MINIEYITYWLEIMKDIKSLEELLLNNITTYTITQNIEHLEHAIENIREIQRLDPLKQSYYDKIFNNP